MKFKHNDVVRLNGSPRIGRVVGFCHYVYNVGDTSVPFTSNVVEGVLVKLTDGFYDPTRTSFVSIMVCQEDTIEFA